MCRRYSVLLGIPVLLAAACTPRIDLAAERQAVMAADSAFDAATAARRVDGWVEFFADSGVMVRPGNNVIGLAAIREAMAPVLDDTAFSLRWRPTGAEVSSDGSLAYTIGRYDATRRMADTTRVSRGSYVTIWRKQPGGSWKVVLDIGNADPPAPSPPPRRSSGP